MQPDKRMLKRKSNGATSSSDLSEQSASGDTVSVEVSSGDEAQELLVPPTDIEDLDVSSNESEEPEEKGGMLFSLL